VTWVHAQTWLDLLFAHWPLPEEIVRGAVPEPLEVDTFEGSAWIGITPFEVTGLRPRGLPPPPVVSRFAETNVRTYVTLGGRPGICFLSLDAASTFAVLAARAIYRLPYFRARMTIERSGDEIAYATARVGGEASLRARYAPVGDRFRARPGSLEHFLVERYSLFTVSLGLVVRTDIDHPPWPLQPARADIAENTMTRPAGIELPATEPLLHYAARQDVVLGPPKPARRAG
jgi:uncharacterized protein YqjF (DUF2071 family)